MGEIRSFRCTSCDYSAEVSGGDDQGMTVTTTTVTCLDCRALMDVVTGERAADGSIEPVVPKCDRRKGHVVLPWSSPGSCPRCHAPMSEDPGGPVAMWD